MSPITVTTETAHLIADGVNAAFNASVINKVNGRILHRRFIGQPVARAWGNGTVSFEVKARTTRGTTTIFAKVGEVVTVE